MLNFDLKVKFKGYFTFLRVRPVSLFCFDIDLPYFGAWVYHIERMCRVYIVYFIYDPDTTLNFDLQVKFIEVVTCPIQNFY